MSVCQCVCLCKFVVVSVQGCVCVCVCVFVCACVSAEGVEEGKERNEALRSLHAVSRVDCMWTMC